MYLARTYVTQNQQLMHCQIYSDTLFLFLSFSLSLFSLSLFLSSLSLSLSLSHAHKRANLQSHITQTHAYTFTCIVHTHSHTHTVTCTPIMLTHIRIYTSTQYGTAHDFTLNPLQLFIKRSFLLPFGLSPGSFLGTTHALTHTRAHSPTKSC